MPFLPNPTRTTCLPLVTPLCATRWIVGSCQPVSTLGANAAGDLWAYNDNLASRISKPDNCFRITVDHGLDAELPGSVYGGRSIPTAPMSRGARIAWEAWEDLTCAPMEFVRHGPGRCLRNVRGPRWIALPTPDADPGPDDRLRPTPGQSTHPFRVS